MNSSTTVFFYPGDATGATMEHAAASGRLRNLAAAARAAGEDAIIVGLADQTGEGPEGPVIGYRPGVGMRGRLRASWDLYRNLKRFFATAGAQRVCLYGTSLFYNVPATLAARHHKMKVITSVNEWGNKAVNPRPVYLLLRAGIWHTARTSDVVIAISSLMEEWFSKHGRGAVVRIPSLFAESTVPDPRPSASPDGTFTLMYAGTIKDQKDAVNNVLRGLALLDDDERAHVQMHVFGSQREDVLTSLGDDADEVLARLADVLHFHGFLPASQLREILAGADATALLRYSEPYANAGFPTKFAESLLLGVPVICNATSDIGLYLRDGHNGWLSAGPEPEHFRDALRRAIACEDREAVRREAAQTGKTFTASAQAPAWSEVSLAIEPR